jgi:hypothetical protein
MRRACPDSGLQQGDPMNTRGPVRIAATAAAVMVCVGCTVRDKRTRGEDLLKKTSTSIANASAFSFSTDEVTERTIRDGTTTATRMQRQITVRRPNRLWFKTAGDRGTEGFYDGARLTLVFHGEKVFGIIPTPPTLDETVHLVSERYDIPLPIGDLITTESHKSLISPQTTGGWEGEELIDGKQCARLEWHHPNVDWTIWIPTFGEPLPKQLWVNYKTNKRTATVLFKDWNLSPKVSEETFESRIPDDYEGVAVIQRAAAVLPNLPGDARDKGSTLPNPQRR